MRTRIQRWVNSLAIRIPKPLAAELQHGQDAEVDSMRIDEHIMLRRVAAPRFTLEQLLAGVTDENMHRETSTGENVGQEAW